MDVDPRNPLKWQNVLEPEMVLALLTRLKNGKSNLFARMEENSGKKSK
jgi:hypothetical protein